ncbi:putative baseplate assembly protein [Rhodococcus aetherivorans]|uniref:putative baseplate assembly protein n=1 Tax=Rhodococcus aetherivorans TaxID=191292 RepID=UPI0036BE8657
MLPAPNLDDRVFQDLVDDARRLVQQRCPRWSDHNVSDPGITLIEACALMIDQLVYRLNRVPERNYIKYLELLGIELRPPAAARCEVTFWLSAPQPLTVTVRSGTEVSTARTDIEDPIVFSTTGPLDIVACRRAEIVTGGTGSEITNRTLSLDRGDGFSCFGRTPTPGDCLYVGLSAAVPTCAVLLRMQCSVSGVGVDPDNPPLVWEAWTGTEWSACTVDRDETGGFNKAGDVVLHVPRTHRMHVLGGKRAGWVRCRLIGPQEDQPTYSQSPRIDALSAMTVGGTVSAINARIVRGELLGISDGTPSQRFALRERPVVPLVEQILVQAEYQSGRSEWNEVETFAGTNATDQVFHIDSVAGEVVFGPAVREVDGTLMQYGAIPPKGAALRISAYGTGGGPSGNVDVGSLRVLKTSTPYVGRVENRRAAVGGAPSETLEEVKTRGPLLLRSRGRAVTAEDFEQLTREAAPEVARVHCLATSDATDAGIVRVLIVPHLVRDDSGCVHYEDLAPQEESLNRIAEYLDARRLVGTRLVVQPPAYQWVTAVVSLTALAGFHKDDVRSAALRRINRLLHPLEGGPQGTGWPVGRAVQRHEVAAALAWTPGVDTAEPVDVQLFPADPATKRRGAATDRVPLGAHALVYSYSPQVRVL